MMRDLIADQRSLAQTVKDIHKGPLGTETCSSEYLAGYVDVHDYGVADGYHRVLLPDYKLHNYQPLLASYGMGLVLPLLRAYHHVGHTMGLASEWLRNI